MKKSYRDRLRDGNPHLRFLYLKGDYATIEARMLLRTGHFFNARMLRSQFDTIEDPTREEDVISVNAARPLADVVSDVLQLVQDVRFHTP